LYCANLKNECGAQGDWRVITTIISNYTVTRPARLSLNCSMLDESSRSMEFQIWIVDGKKENLQESILVIGVKNLLE